MSGQNQHRGERRRGARGPHGEELRVELGVARRHRRVLAISTALLLLACGVLGAWALRQQSVLWATLNRKQAEVAKLSAELAAATTEAEEARRAVDALVMDRIPGLLPFRTDEPLSVDLPFVQEISFKQADAPVNGYECKLVVENDSDIEIRPALSARIFDEFGIQLSEAQLMDGVRDELRADEVRSFFANLEIPKGRVARYFQLISN